MATILNFPTTTTTTTTTTDSWFEVGRTDALSGRRQVTPNFAYDSRSGRAAVIAREYRAGYAAGHSTERRLGITRPVKGAVPRF